MVAGSRQQAKRSFVTVLLTIAALDSVWLMVARDLLDEACESSFKRVLLKARPNKGSLPARPQRYQGNLGQSKAQQDPKQGRPEEARL